MHEYHVLTFTHIQKHTHMHIHMLSDGTNLLSSMEEYNPSEGKVREPPSNLDACHVGRDSSTLCIWLLSH
jgi:hypothetical protein